MIRFLQFALALAVAGCTASPQHARRVESLRATVPYVTRIGFTHSMATVVPAASRQVVSALPYNRLQTGLAVVFWPASWPTPVCHFVGRRVGTDSWSTHGMNQSSDLTNGLGFLLTRENYIGVIL